MINNQTYCELCKEVNYVSLIYGKYVACDVCITNLISQAKLESEEE
tara:strand:+ start:7440 stop:7577 length:138 start_codon:yes stop_codon:yes gene_type:complete